MTRSNRNSLIFFVTLISVFAFALFTNIAPRVIAEKRQPGSTIYGFPTPWLNDYFQYISIIKMGQEGKLLYHNQYSEEYFPPLLLQPYYNILGVMTKPLGIDPFQAFFLAMLLSLCALIATVAFLAKKLFPSHSTASLVLILFITATNFWTFAHASGIQYATEPETYSNWFNIFKKLTMFPFHHYLSVIWILLMLYHFLHLKKNALSFIVTALLGFLLSLMHPYNAISVLYILGVQLILTTLIKRKIPFLYIVHLLLAAVSIAPLIFYTRYLLTNVWGGVTTQANTLAWTPPIVSFSTYLFALGPLLVPALLASIQPKHFMQEKWRMMMLWVIVPIVVFYLPNIGIPTGGIRLFQTFQQIPLAILAALLFDQIASFAKRFSFLVYGAAAVFFIGFAAPAYSAITTEYASPLNHYFYVDWIVNLSIPTMQFLKSHTPYRSVVLTGDNLGMMIPAFTDNRVIVGNDGDNRNYYTKLKDVQVFFNGNIPLDQLPSFLKKYNVEYVVWGIDSIELERSPYKNSPYFEEVFRDKTVSVSKVKRI